MMKDLTILCSTGFIMTGDTLNRRTERGGIIHYVGINPVNIQEIEMPQRLTLVLLRAAIPSPVAASTSYALELTCYTSPSNDVYVHGGRWVRILIHLY